MEQSPNVNTQPMSRLKRMTAFLLDRHSIPQIVDYDKTAAQALPVQLVIEGLAQGVGTFIKTEMTEDTRDL